MNVTVAAFEVTILRRYIRVHIIYLFICNLFIPRTGGAREAYSDARMNTDHDDDDTMITITIMMVMVVVVVVVVVVVMNWR